MSYNTEVLCEAAVLTEELIEAWLIKRYKRFLADVQIPGIAEPITVHCPNPGSMLGVAAAGSKIWLRPARNPKAKLKYSWVLTELDSGYVNVDTLMANKLLEESLKKGIPGELGGYASLKREQSFKESRFDFFLAEHASQADCFVEVKSTTMQEGGIAMFPDAKTERGRKHLEHLILCKNEGFRAVQFFCVCRADLNLFKPAEHIDKLYAEGLRKAHDAGVEALVYSVDIQRNGRLFEIAMHEPMELSLN